MEKTLIIIKPDAVQREKIGEITSRFENKGLKLVATKITKLTPKILKEHYKHLVDRDFFPELSEFMQRSPVVIQCWEGNNAINVVRKMCGATHAQEANFGTIRGDFGNSQQRNIIHASEDIHAAKEEIERFFEKHEIVEYEKNETLIYSSLER